VLWSLLRQLAGKAGDFRLVSCYEPYAWICFGCLANKRDLGFFAALEARRDKAVSARCFTRFVGLSRHVCSGLRPLLAAFFASRLKK